MATATREALSAIEKAKPVTKEDVLKLIPQFEINPIFKRQHLNRELVIGSIGERGGGKSGSDAVISISDFMLAGKPLWSNMNISCDIGIDDETAQRYGLRSGGIAHYQSEPLDKDALLSLDDRYRDGALEIEEINVQYSNVRRFMTNTNVDFNEVCQQLRKFGVSLIYNVIDEMFIDPQLRTLTDIFIKTYDTAFDIESLNNKKPTGVDFCWYVYPMTGYLAGQQGKYAVTQKAIGPIYCHFSNWQGTYNTLLHQEKGVYSMSSRDKRKMFAASISTESSGDIVAETNKWKWLEDKAIKLKNSGIRTLSPAELTRKIGQPLTQTIRTTLRSYGIVWNAFSQSYTVSDYSLSLDGVTA